MKNSIVCSYWSWTKLFIDEGLMSLIDFFNWLGTRWGWVSFFVFPLLFYLCLELPLVYSLYALGWPLGALYSSYMIYFCVFAYKKNDAFGQHMNSRNQNVVFWLMQQKEYRVFVCRRVSFLHLCWWSQSWLLRSLGHCHACPKETEYCMKIVKSPAITFNMYHIWEKRKGFWLMYNIEVKWVTGFLPIDSFMPGGMAQRGEKRQRGSFLFANVPWYIEASNRYQ